VFLLKGICLETRKSLKDHGCEKWQQMALVVHIVAECQRSKAKPVSKAHGSDSQSGKNGSTQTS